MEANPAERPQDQQLSLTDSVLCFNTELLLPSITQSSNEGLLYFSLSDIICFIALYQEVQNHTHFNKPFK